MAAFVLGFDIGTSVTKAALFGADGAQLAVAARRTPLAHPFPGWVETDPEAVWTNAAAVCREVLAAAGVGGSDVAGVGVCGAMVGAWTLDAAARPLRPAILWEDDRCQGMIEEMERAAPGLLSRIFAISGSVMQQGCTLPLLRWLVRHEPEVMRAAAGVVGAKDFVRFRLTGRLATDITEAAVAPGSARDRARSPELLAVFGLEEWAHLLSPALDSAAVAGEVTAAAAEQTGLAAGTPVVAGAGDVPASTIGAGGSRAGIACSILGTTCHNGVLLDAPAFEPPDLGLEFTIPGGLWFRSMVNVAGTVNIDWLLASLCPDLASLPDRYARLEELAKAGGIGAGGVRYVPYLSEAGIIAPRVAPLARGAYAGLTPRHRRAHLVRAVYEGVAFAIRDCYAVIGRPIERIRMVGGGARSCFWCQMFADVTQKEVEVPLGSEFGAKGAALLAATALSWYASVPEAAEAGFAVARRFSPDPAAGGAYEAHFRSYRVWRDAVIDAAPAAVASTGGSL
jgi:sugar (pentulose or hexulose) kinase